MLLLLLVSLLSSTQTRDAAPARAGIATLSGVVLTDDATSRPIARAMVTLASTANARNQWTTATDDAGRFAFTALPAGNFTLVAQKPAYVTAYFGAKRPGATVGVPIALTDGQRMANVTLRLLHGAVITGTVFDETGRPMQGAPVRLKQVSVSASGTRTSSDYRATVVPSTDDRGMYRIFGLPPGDYLVSVQPRVTGAGELRQTTPAELQWAEQQIRLSVGSVAPAAPSGQQPPPPGGTMTYANVFYPNTANEASATTVTVAAGQERAGIDIRALFVATARIDGIVTDPNGQPAAGVQLTLLPQDTASSTSAVDVSRLLVQMEVGLMAGTGARTNASGAFSIAGVAPGNYSLMASTATRAGLARGTGPSVSPGLWAMTELAVNGQDIPGIALTLAPGMTVSGRFAFQGTPPPDQTRISIAITSAQSSAASVLGSVGQNAADPSFSVTGLAPGRYRFGATVGSWTLVSAMLGGRDVADLPFEIRPGENVSDLVVTFTDKPAELTGQLTDAAGRPAPSFVLLLFTTDRSLWYPGSRRLRAPLGPASDGRFSFTNLTPGEYYLAAATDVSPTEWFDPAFLDQVALSAIKVTLAAGEKKVQDVRVR